jgi:hypothetical protein
LGGLTTPPTERSVAVASEKKVDEFMREAGFHPLEDRCIVVSFQPRNLSDKVAKFFSCQFYALQLCEDELVVAPFDSATSRLKRDDTLTVAYDTIQRVEVTEDGFNYRIEIQTADGEIVLQAQQKELSFLRSSGYLAGLGNWHKENLDATLAALKELGARR